MGYLSAAPSKQSFEEVRSQAGAWERAGHVGSLARAERLPKPAKPSGLIELDSPS